MGRRTLLLIAAVLLAAIGTSVLFLYVNSISGPDAGTGQSGRALAPAELIPAGTTITESTPLVEVPVDASAITRGALVQQKRDIVGRIANRELLAFQPLSIVQFGGAVQEPSAVSLDEGGPDGGYVAVTVEVEDAARNADLLRRGNVVAVWVVDPDVTGGGAQNDTHQARLILERVKILTIGSAGTIARVGTGEEEAGAPAGSTALVTLQVTQAEAGKIMVADVAGDLRFTLLAPDAQPTRQTYGDETLITNPQP